MFIPKRLRHYRVTNIVIATVVGFGIGVFFALRFLTGIPNADPVLVTMCGGVVVAIAANLLLLIDVEPGSRTAVNGGTVVRNFIAVLALIFCLLPFLGVVLAAISFAVNRKVGGWQRISAIACLMLSLAVLLLVVGTGLVNGSKA